MLTKRGRTILKLSLIIAGLVLLLLSAIFAVFGMLGTIGVLADVGPDENRKMGTQILWIASVPFGLGVIALVSGLLIRKSEQAR